MANKIEARIVDDEDPSASSFWTPTNNKITFKRSFSTLSNNRWFLGRLFRWIRWLGCLGWLCRMGSLRWLRCLGRLGSLSSLSQLCSRLCSGWLCCIWSWFFSWISGNRWSWGCRLICVSFSIFFLLFLSRNGCYSNSWRSFCSWRWLWNRLS